MDIGKESDPIEVPVPVQPDQVPDGAPVPGPVTPERVPA